MPPPRGPVGETPAAPPPAPGLLTETGDKVPCPALCPEGHPEHRSLGARRVGEAQPAPAPQTARRRDRVARPARCGGGPQSAAAGALPGEGYSLNRTWHDTVPQAWAPRHTCRAQEEVSARGHRAHHHGAPGLGRQRHAPPLHPASAAFARSGSSRSTPTGHFLALLPHRESRQGAAGERAAGRGGFPRGREPGRAGGV